MKNETNKTVSEIWGKGPYRRELIDGCTRKAAQWELRCIKHGGDRKAKLIQEGENFIILCSTPNY